MGYPDGTLKPFFSDSQLKHLRMVATTGLQTQVVIKRRTTSDSDYGDGEIVSWSIVSTVKGWIHSNPTPVAQSDSGSVITVNTYRLYVPVGTDIKPGDQAVIKNEDYIVSDTTAESTWQTMILCSLRKRE